MRRAFTLIELLVVISIIALLIAILLPALGKARESADLSQCLVNHRQVGSGLVSYAVDNKGQFPMAPNQGGNGLPYFYVHNAFNPDGTKFNLAKTILDYLADDPRIFVCPLAPAHAPPDPDQTGSARWNYVYMGNYDNAGYTSPVTSIDGSSSEDGLWGEHTANVGPSWGRFRSNHASRAAQVWDDDDDPNLGPAYAQWSSQEEEDIESVTNVFADGSARLLQTEEMYRRPSGFGYNFLPPNSEYGPEDSIY